MNTILTVIKTSFPLIPILILIHFFISIWFEAIREENKNFEIFINDYAIDLSAKEDKAVAFVKMTFKQFISIYEIHPERYKMLYAFYSMGEYIDGEILDYTSEKSLFYDSNFICVGMIAEYENSIGLITFKDKDLKKLKYFFKNKENEYNDKKIVDKYTKDKIRNINAINLLNQDIKKEENK